MTVDEIVQLLLAGGIIGFLMGLAGVGGGVLLNPTLTNLFGLTNPVAVATAATFALIPRGYAAFQHAKLRNIAWPQAFTFLGWALPGAGGSAFLVSHLAGGADRALFNWWLGNGILAVILCCLALMLVQSRRDHAEGTELEAPADGTRNRIAEAAAGFLTGTVMGATGIGGGVLVIPLLMLIFKLKVGKTVGSSIFIAEMISIVMVIVYTLLGGKGQAQPEYMVALVMVAGSVMGVRLGSRISVKLPSKTLKRMVILLITLSLCWKAWESWEKGQELFGITKVDLIGKD